MAALELSALAPRRGVEAGSGDHDNSPRLPVSGHPGNIGGGVYRMTQRPLDVSMAGLQRAVDQLRADHKTCDPFDCPWRRMWDEDVMALHTQLINAGYLIIRKEEG